MIRPLLRVTAVVVAMAITGLGFAAGRRALAAWLSGDGTARPQRPLRAPAAPTIGAGARAPVRVVILDGLTRADAGLPALDALCATGVDLAVDVGFPTKSLPVQAVLWTGLTAQQLGLGPNNRRATIGPAGLPVRFPDSLAVVEAWTSIAHAMGFAQVVPGAAADDARVDHDPIAAARWHDRFVDEAAAAVAGPAPLVLVHVLAIDRVAHHHGRSGARYQAALAAADRALARVVDARPDASWVVLADHGHVPAGGHGDAEPTVRIVRGCVSPAPAGAPAAGAVHLIDVARHLRDLLAIAPEPAAAGRPLAAALAAVDPDATLPPRPVTRGLAAALILVLTFAVTLAATRPRWPVAWLPVATGLYLVWQGIPTLSARDPRAALVCALVTGLPAMFVVRDHPRRVVALVLPAVGVAIAAAVAAGLPAALLDGRPPATPVWTAVVEVAVTVAAAAVTAAVGWITWSATPDVTQPLR